MKPSHRKDVIIARIIFAFICIALIAIIVSVVILITSHFKDRNKSGKNMDTQKQTESQKEDNDIYEDVPIVTPDEEVAPQKVLVKTTSSVNLRKEADKESEVLSVVPEGTELIVILEQDGWAKVEYAGNTGYVYTEYIQQIATDESNESDKNESHENESDESESDAEGND